MKKSAVNPELKNIVEAALLVAHEPVTLERLQQLFPEADARPTRDELRAALDSLSNEYESRGIEIKQIDKGYRVQTRDRYSTFLQRLVEERPPRYSRALLETLAIVAYRQPVTRGDIEQIRGVSVSTEIIKTLLGREWIREVGRREVPGRPVLYGTSREFLEHFNLKSLEELPPLAAVRPLEQISAELDQRLAQAGAGVVAHAELGHTVADEEGGSEGSRDENKAAALEASPALDAKSAVSE
jgi:segregation and condensation protein B